MKKRIFALLLAAMMTAAVFTGCSSRDNSNSDAQNNTQTQQPAEPAKPEETKKDVSVDDVVKAVKEAYGENYYPSMPLEAQMLTDIMGINMDDVDSFYADMSAMSANIDCFIVLKAKEGKIDSVYEQLNNYREIQLNDTMCYPSNALRIQGSQIMKVGDYAVYMMLGAHPEMEASEDDAVKFAQEQGQIGVDAINALFA